MLPDGASHQSHARLALARELTDLCPLELGAEIALEGSVARGWADDYSDIELNLWTEELEPWPRGRVEWIESIGGRVKNVHSEVHPTGSRWIEFDYKDNPVEAGWHAFASCDDLLTRILAGQVSDAFQLYLAESLAHAVPLREGEHLDLWRASLTYTEALRRTMIESAIERWRVDHFPLDAAFILRPDPSLVVLRADASIRSCLRILFALNERWEPDTRKWLDRWVATLDVKPERFAERAHAVYRDPLAPASHTELLSLIADTLALVPEQYGLAGVRAIVAAAQERWAQRNVRQRSAGQ